MKAWLYSFLLSCAVLGAHNAHAQEVTFRRAVELALQHSGTMAIASADEMRAEQNLQEARDLFIPQVTVGSGLAQTWGFPLSIEGAAPSIVNVNSQSFIFNAAQREFIRAARQDWKATSYLAQDRKNQVILETAVDYAELDNMTSTLSVLREQEGTANHAQQVVSDRVQAGVDSEVELTRAKLSAAKARLKIAEMEGTADALRLRLSQLTGLPADSIRTMTESIPKLPEINQSVDLAGEAANNSPAVKEAAESAESKKFRAQGEHKQNYPAIDFVAQYGIFSKYNHFQDYFKRFQRNNATVGVAIRFPFLNFSQRAHAEAADAEAVAAQKEAEGVKDQVSSQTLKLQRSLRRLAAAKEVARLEYDLAHSDTEAAHARVQSGGATVKDEDNARVNEQESYVALLQTSFELDKAEMQLLRATNGLQQWALPGAP